MMTELERKAWYTSKIVWLMVLQSAISVLLLVQEWISKGDFSVVGIIGLVIGILTIVIRIWLTDQPIMALRKK